MATAVKSTAHNFIKSSIHRQVRRNVLLAMMLLSAIVAPAASAGEAQATASPPPDTAHSFKPPTFSENTVTYAYGPNYRNPFIKSASQPDGADIARNSITFTHFDAWKYGHNFVDVIFKSSNAVEPAAGGGTGAMGFYSIFRAGLSINRVSGRPLIALGPLSDIDIQAGVNLQGKNTAMAPNERSLYLGPNFQFRFGSGFLNVALQLRQEWNRNGMLGKNEHYDLGFNIEPFWNFPFHIGRAEFVFDGFIDYNSTKGQDVSGRDTRAEFIVRPQLQLDIGSAFGLSRNVLALGIAAEYWHNLYGVDADRIPGARQLTPVVSLTVHLPSRSPAH